MILSVINSGSSCNCYVLHNGKDALVLEAGAPCSMMLKMIGYKRSIIQGLLISHEHGDHAKYVNQYARMGIPVYMSEGTRDNLHISFKQMIKIVKAMQLLHIGNFTILPFDTVHDSAQPLGYIISHAEIGNLMFATDTAYIKYNFLGLNNVMIECNYDYGILESNIKNGIVPAFLRQRIINSHMSIDNCIRTLQKMDLSQVGRIILIHLSDKNSNAGDFIKRIEREVGKLVIVADKNMNIRLTNNSL